ncbi:MAG: hypothetical protein KGI08_05250 [Thaumarchaeota archaeon]|nr:hypothetical protein [Nitrososphaerota archaeon]
MAIQNNGKTEKVELTPEEKKLLDTPIPDDAEIEDEADPVTDVIHDPHEPEGDAEIIPDEEEETPEEKAAREKKEKGEGEHPQETEEEKKAREEKEKKEKEEKEKQYNAQKQESELLNEQRKGIISAIDKSEKVEPPTEEELKAYVKEKGGDWDVLDDFQKNLAKDNLIAKKKQEALNQGLKAVKDVNEWADRVDTFLDENQTKQSYKEIIGREEEFRQWCLRKASARGISWEYLVPSFMRDVKEVARKKGSLLLHGGGGEKPKGPTEPGVITDAAQVAQLRVSNPKEYRRLSKAGKIRVTAE